MKKLLLLFFILSMIFSCENEKSARQKAFEAKTESPLINYLKKYPESEYVDSLNILLKKIKRRALIDSYFDVKKELTTTGQFHSYIRDFDESDLTSEGMVMRENRTFEGEKMNYAYSIAQDANLIGVSNSQRGFNIINGAQYKASGLLLNPKSNWTNQSISSKIKSIEEEASKLTESNKANSNQGIEEILAPLQQEYDVIQYLNYAKNNSADILFGDKPVGDDFFLILSLELIE